MWNLPQHSYEEIREVVIDVMSASSSNGVNQFQSLLEHVGRTFGKKHNASPLSTGMAYPGAGSQLHPQDSDLVLEVVWDLFRQGIITLGLNTSNPGWPWIRLSRFGRKTIQNQPYRFHDTASFLILIRNEVPDISSEAIAYLDEAVAAFYAGCLLASCVMLGVAAEAEFLRLLDVAVNSQSYADSFKAVTKENFVRSKITKFQAALKPLLPTFMPKKHFEDLETNLSLIQSVLRVARNDAGHPTGIAIPEREQVYVFLQLFVPFARQLMRLREALT